ncbi:putative Rho-type GTPase-activating protein 4 [Lachnellula arida]|uniref:Putative Rho-type GTPase-activating protein 4 n=1 Tax=Lachnellula arida TaxID=1316785 RepID=A0A8T9BJ47_9HELO|nr:putative Rho-type GTPase-activating protein 4 [Lachnellula arida]
MESPADYLDSPTVDSDDVAFPCKGCGDILEEGKAFELAGHRWHLNCFRCNTCSTLLDSDANLLLLGDGSLICNNCTYSCSACGNKIEDLAILTGDQAFCATCFRCRNCKRKIENLRYARTSQGIFCMSCHESLMARRRKKSRAAANAKLKKDDQSPMLVDKSLPALPPNAISQSAFSSDRETPGSVDTDTPTELSPRPRTTYQHDSSSRSSSRRTRDPSAERTSSDGPAKDGLILPTTTYRNHRHSVISQASDVNGGDGESLFIPLAFDPSPAPNPTPRSTTETWGDPSKRSKDTKENKVSEKDYFNLSKSNGRSGSQKMADSPHIAFQEKGREPSSEETLRIKESIQRAQAGGKGSARGSPVTGSDDVRVQHATSPQSSSPHNKSQTSNEKFRLGDVPKGKKSGNSRSNSQSDYGDTSSRSTSSGGPSSVPPRKESAIGIPQTDSPKSLLATEKAGTPRSSQDSRRREDAGPRSSIDFKNPSNEVQWVDSGETGKSIPRKEIPSGPVKTAMSSMSSSSGPETSPSTASSTDTPGHTPTINGKSISGPVLQSSSDDDLVPPSRAPTRPTGPQQKLSDTYMAPRAPPAPPPLGSHTSKESTHQVNGASTSPNLPRWSAGGDFTMDEDMARILGETDESSQSILRRVSNAVRHGRNNSEASINIRHQGHGRSVSETTARTVASPRWPKTPTVTENSSPANISSPISITSPVLGEDPSVLRRQLRNSEQRIAELERQFVSEKDLKSLNKKLIEKRKTVSVLDSQTEIMIRQLEVLAGWVEKAKDSNQPLEIAELEDSAIKEFVQKLERLKQTMSSSVESLYEDRNKLMEEKNQVMAETNQIMADRDRALVEFEQLSSKNAQLADMNNDLTHQIQERFKAQSGSTIESPRPPMNGLGIYTHHNKDKSNVSINMDDASLRPSMSTTVFGSTNSYPQPMDQDPSMEPATVLSAPHVINIRKGQAKKFNWKKGSQTVAKGVSKGFKGAFSSAQQPERNQWQGQTGDSIGMPYNMTMVSVEAPASGSSGSLPRSVSNDPSRQGFGIFKKGTMPRSMSNGNFAPAEDPSRLFGSELVERANYERRQIPSVVTRCIEEVELRGMDIEGIYRKTGGSGQVKIIQEGFDKTNDYDISDPDLDITAVTSVLKQYFRKLPTPLLTFDVYDRVLESISIDDDKERCTHLRRTFNMLPPKHRDCLEFLIFHLARVAVRESENLMTPKNLAVVFAPTIMRDHSLEREMTDMHSKNGAVQFVIENSHEIFGNA